MKTMIPALFLTLTSLSLASLTACDDNTEVDRDMERAGERLERVGDDMAVGADHAIDEAGHAIDDAGRAIEAGAEEIDEEIHEAARDDDRKMKRDGAH